MTEPFILPGLRPIPTIVTPAGIEPGDGRTLLLVVAHADDPAFFVGGPLILWSHAGWRIHCLRVTDDRWDSVGLEEPETVARNTSEFAAAAKLLGIDAIDELGWQTDVLGDASRVALRERIIHAIRRVQPYGVVSFDPNSLFNEDNLDHKVLAEAVDEATWTAQFDKHHPEHFAEGLAPHGIVERWYFGRSVPAVTHVFDTSDVVEQQVAALCCHRTMLANIARQFWLQARTARIASPLITAAEAGDLEPLAKRLIVSSAASKGGPFGVAAAEYLRLSRSAVFELA